MLHEGGYLTTSAGILISLRVTKSLQFKNHSVPFGTRPLSRAEKFGLSDVIFFLFFLMTISVSEVL